MTPGVSNVGIIVFTVQEVIKALVSGSFATFINAC